jgi:FAD binding domain
MSTSVSTTSGRESGSATDENCHKVGAHPCCADRIIQFGRAPTDSAEKWGRWQIPMSGRRLSGSSRRDALVAATGDPARVSASAVDRHALANDASHFRLTPQAVVTAPDGAEVGRLFAVSAAHGVPLTLRAGGTSLAGQAVSDGVLVDVRPGARSARSSRRRRQLRWRARRRPVSNSGRACALPWCGAGRCVPRQRHPHV